MKDPISILEAAYDLGAPDQAAWLRRAAGAVRENVPSSEGAVAYAYSVRDDGYVVPTAPVEIDTPSTFGQSLLSVDLDAARSALLSRYYLTSGLGFGSRLARQMGQLGAAFFAHAIVAHGFGDLLTLNATDPSRSGCMVGVVLPRTGQAGKSETVRWNRVAAHLAAGFRLRRRLDAGVHGDDGEAVLSASGKVEHATGDARAPSAREALRAAVLSAERARGPLRRRRPDEAIEIWRGLTMGRWSLVDRFDHDGRRYLVAHPNDPDAPDARALTRRERQVVGYAALGQPNKLIAYELGLSPSTVGVLLSRAARKLGARSRAELLRFGGVAGST